MKEINQITAIPECMAQQRKVYRNYKFHRPKYVSEFKPEQVCLM